ncbi:hypothetical protein EYR38_002304 [Pleurotus pulmonarius]|nr:hypothetical protein EYR38_002304 [Pleurotus pulmonarius]
MKDTCHSLSESIKVKLEKTALGKCCTLTLDPHDVDIAHIVEATTNWPRLHALREAWHTKDLPNVDSPLNLMYLRVDWHRLFDRCQWGMLPTTKLLWKIFAASVVNQAAARVQNPQSDIFRKFSKRSKSTNDLSLRYEYQLLWLADGDPDVYPSLTRRRDDATPYLDHAVSNNTTRPESSSAPPYADFPTFESHVHPFFVIINTGDKLSRVNNPSQFGRGADMLLEIYRLWFNYPSPAESPRAAEPEGGDDDDDDQSSHSSRTDTDSSSFVSGTTESGSCKSVRLAQKLEKTYDKRATGEPSAICDGDNVPMLDPCSSSMGTPSPILDSSVPGFHSLDEEEAFDSEDIDTSVLRWLSSADAGPPDEIDCLGDRILREYRKEQPRQAELYQWQQWASCPPKIPHVLKSYHDTSRLTSYHWSLYHGSVNLMAPMGSHRIPWDPSVVDDPAVDREYDIYSRRMHWQKRSADRKRAQLESIPSQWHIKSLPEDVQNVLDIPRACGILSERELEITETVGLDTILDKLRSGEWTSVETTTAYYKRAIVAHQVTNCLTEIFVERSLERAQELDDYLRVHRKPVGPLHGLPISLKDQFNMKGLETIMGYVGRIGQYAESDCVIVEMLYDLGAVPFVRTNVPQTLMWGETYNHVFGRTTNPYNRSLTCGGSSGGEGALIAMKGSPLGIGTDIGGSLRIPSAFCGLYTLRPSYERLPYCGASNALEGQESISSVLGPMSNSLSGVKIFTKAIIDGKPWKKDPLAIRKVWSEEEYQLSEHGGRGANLCFAIMWDNGVVKPHPPLIRAMQMTRDALEAAGHKVIEWIPHRHMEIYKNALWQLHKEKRELRKSHLDHWESTIADTGTGRPVDAIISPAVAYTAVPHGLNTDSFYTTLCNAMDYACSCFPVTFVDPKIDKKPPPHSFHNHEDEAIYDLYDPELFAGLPVVLQLIGRTLEEEGVIAMTEVVDAALKGHRS